MESIHIDFISNLVPRASFPLTSGRKTRALGATISGMRHRCRCAVTRITRIRLFPLFFHNGCSQSSRFPNAGRLQRLQNRSARIITHCSRSSEAIEQLHWPTLSSRRSYHKTKLVFLCLQSLVPSYFSLYFTRFSNIHNYSTRQSMRLCLPNVKRNFGKRTFLFTGAEIFNKLPLNIVNSKNIQTICRQARHFFLS